MNSFLKACMSMFVSVMAFAYGTRIGRIVLHLLVLLVGLGLFPQVLNVIERHGPMFVLVTQMVWLVMLMCTISLLACAYIFSAALADVFGLRLGKHTHNIVPWWLGVGVVMTIYFLYINPTYGISCWVITCLSMFVFLELVVVRRIKPTNK